MNGVWAKDRQRMANCSIFKETADDPTGNMEHWFRGSCGQRFASLVNSTTFEVHVRL